LIILIIMVVGMRLNAAASVLLLLVLGAVGCKVLRDT
jgi:hypothetical protein